MSKMLDVTWHLHDLYTLSKLAMVSDGVWWGACCQAGVSLPGRALGTRHMPWLVFLAPPLLFLVCETELTRYAIIMTQDHYP